MTIARKTLHLRLVENMEVDPATKCWNWTGYVLPEGYGQFNLSVADGWVRAHRKSYELFHGKIPDGGHVLHRCNNKRCVNPTHLYVGADKENCADRILAGTQRSKILPADRWDIALSTLSTKELAAKYGLSDEYVRVIKRRHKKATSPK